MVESVAIVVAVLVALLSAAHLAGAAFAALRQPRVVGEILGGVLVGPPLLRHALPGVVDVVEAEAALPVALDAAHGLGLALLMALSGARMRGLLGSADGRTVAWLAGFGTVLPFLATVGLAALLPIDALLGRPDLRTPLVLLLGVVAAVTSIPVISRIFHDLGLLETRFARVVLGVAVIEDVALWVVLALALSLARSAGSPGVDVARHLALTVAFVAVAGGLLPALVARLGADPRNALARRAPLGWLLLVLAATCAAAAACGVSLVLSAFFAGLALGGGEAGPPQAVRAALARVDRAAFATAIPLYFAVVGWRLDLVHALRPGLVLAVLTLACALKLGAVALGGALAGLRGLPLLNVAIATNARGGPGIVIASVALAAGIVSDAGYTALVLLAVLTSQAAGVWLAWVKRRRLPLLGDPDEHERAPALRHSGSGLFLEPDPPSRGAPSSSTPDLGGGGATRGV